MSIGWSEGIFVIPHMHNASRAMAGLDVYDSLSEVV